jgi:hypothetical protein
MKNNLGPLDRLVRLILGNLLIFLALFQIIPYDIYAYMILAGGALLLTSFFSFCPIYALLGIQLSNKEG